MLPEAQAPEDVPEPAEKPGWTSAGVTLALGVAIVLAATAAGFAAATAFDRWTHFDEARAFAAGETEALLTARVSSSLFAFQVVTLLGVLIAGAHLSRPGSPLVSFAMPPGGVRTLALAVLALMALASLYGGAIYALDREAFRSDLVPFAELMRSRTWWLVLIAAGIGAPLAEESLFRGFLFGRLKETPIGLYGAAFLTAVMWAMLHANYSLYGLVAITLIGLYLAAVRERTGSLLAPVVCHGTYNSLIVLLLAFAPGSVIAGA